MDTRTMKPPHPDTHLFFPALKVRSSIASINHALPEANKITIKPNLAFKYYHFTRIHNVIWVETLLHQFHHVYSTYSILLRQVLDFAITNAMFTSTCPTRRYSPLNQGVIHQVDSLLILLRIVIN
mmetsp:Transcript_6793/g.7820  ORF Transcript_6793/g.7820 Transcript_6793/m.7820 type:complete len:125 (+) Transcript_6793:132-506(+)